jgi:hypothetical protein
MHPPRAKSGPRGAVLVEEDVGISTSVSPPASRISVAARPGSCQHHGHVLGVSWLKVVEDDVDVADLTPNPETVTVDPYGWPARCR